LFHDLNGAPRLIAHHLIFGQLPPIIGEQPRAAANVGAVTNPPQCSSPLANYRRQPYTRTK
jgi:hypothetical protein